jgi:hypothetical protein
MTQIGRGAREAGSEVKRTLSIEGTEQVRNWAEKLTTDNLA